MRTRLVLIAAGLLLTLFGVFRIVTQVPAADILVLFAWLVGALILHDGILSPIIVTIGAAVSRFVPPRARRFLAPALVTAGLITVIALPLIYKENSQPASKAILQQNYGGNLTVLLGIVAALALISYLVTAIRDHSGERSLAAPDQRPTTEPAAE